MDIKFFSIFSTSFWSCRFPNVHGRSGSFSKWRILEMAHRTSDNFGIAELGRFLKWAIFLSRCKFIPCIPFWICSLIRASCVKSWKKFKNENGDFVFPQDQNLGLVFVILEVSHNLVAHCKFKTDVIMKKEFSDVKPVKYLRIFSVRFTNELRTFLETWQ